MPFVKEFKDVMHEIVKVNKEISQQELADAVGLSSPAVKKWFEGGKVDLQNLIKICEATNHSPNEILGYVDDKTLSTDEVYLINQIRKDDKLKQIIMDIIKVFGNNLKKYRNAIGLSQEAFADKCGMHRTYISAIERYRRSIALENVQRIADALEIETYKLFLED